MKEASDLPADGEAEARPAVLAARAAVGLLEGLEDDLLLFRGDPDPRIRHRDREDRAGAIQGFHLGTPALPDSLDAQRDPPPLRELEGVGEQVLDDLLPTPLASATCRNVRST